MSALIERSAAAGFAAALIFLAVIGVVSFRSTAKFVETERWVSHTYEVMANIEEVRSALKDCERGIWAYDVSGHLEALQPYSSALGEEGAGRRQLRALTADNAVQQKRLDELDPLIGALEANWKTIIERRSASAAATSDAAPARAQDTKQFEQVGALLEVMRQAEQSLLVRRAAESARVARQTKLTIVLGGALAGALVILAAALVFSDIATRKRIERDLAQARDAALSSSRAKSEFLANMSHEIRTPMNAVIGMTNLLLDTELTAPQREFATTVRNSGEALLSILNDILDLSKIEARKLTFESLDFDLRETVEETLELAAERASAKHIELNALLEPDVPARAHGDPGRLRQVLLNLVGNAVKFTERGGVSVRVRKLGESPGRVKFRFEVTDTGIGITPEAQSTLFQPFMQADGSTTRRYGGTGLGLVISRQLVELMAGEIGVESAPGKGSTFWFAVELGTAAPVADDQRLDTSSLNGARVLIVDDNETNRLVLEHQTRAWKMRHASAAGPFEALELLRHSAADPFALVLTDMQMPGMDGLALARAIRATPAGARLGIILLTSIGTRLEPAELQAAGIAACLLKPVKQSRLFDCLATTLGGRSAPAPARAAEEPPAPAPERHLRILLVEDNPVNQRLALAQLRKFNHTVEAVGNGREALDNLARVTYDVILMDCQMPEMDGYQATRLIREREQARAGAARRAYVIALTAHAMSGDREKCLAAGMDDYLSKPLRIPELRAALERCPARPSAPGQPSAGQIGAAAGPAAAPDEPLIDEEAWQELLAVDALTRGELIELYRAQAAEKLAALDGAIAERNAGKIGALAHTFRGASATCALRALPTILQKLESEAAAGRLEAAAGCLARARELSEASLQALAARQATPEGLNV